MFEENIEWLFNADVREKKKIASGIHGRALRLRKNEAVKMPSELLKGFEKKRICGAGPCRLTSMGEIFMLDWSEQIKNGTIPTPDEIDAISAEQGFEIAQKLFAELLRIHTGRELQSKMPLMKDHARFKEFCGKYQIAKDRKGNVFIGEAAVKYVLEQQEKKLSTANSAKNKNQKVEDTTLKNQGKVKRQNGVQAMEIPAETQSIELKQVTLIEPHPLIYQKRKYTAEQLSKFFERIRSFLDDKTEYELEITLKEVN